MKNLLSIQLHNRKIFNHYLKQYSLAQLNKIPEGFNNNIIWNIAHTVITHQLLLYRMTGNELQIPTEWVKLFAKGSKPERDMLADEVKAIDAALFSTYEQFEKDITSGLFNNYQSYTTSTNMVLDSVETTQSFLLFHDGIHLGSVLALAKLV